MNTNIETTNRHIGTAIELQIHKEHEFKVRELVFSDDVQIWQEEFREPDGMIPERAGPREWIVGDTAYFDDPLTLVMAEEAAKAFLPGIYAWLMEHAPEANVHLSSYEDDSEQQDGQVGDADVSLRFADEETSELFAEFVASEVYLEAEDE